MKGKEHRKFLVDLIEELTQLRKKTDEEILEVLSQVIHNAHDDITLLPDED